MFSSQEGRGGKEVQKERKKEGRKERSQAEGRKYVSVIKLFSIRGKINVMINSNDQGFPDVLVVKNLPANAGDTGSNLGPGRSHMT